MLPPLVLLSLPLLSSVALLSRVPSQGPLAPVYGPELSLCILVVNEAYHPP